MPPLLWCFHHPERSTSLKIFILTPKHNNTKKKKSKLNVFLISSKFCSSLHPSTLASVVLFEYSGCDGKQLFDLREACTLSDAYLKVIHLFWIGILLFIVTALSVPLCTVISVYCSLLLSMLLCCCVVKCINFFLIFWWKVFIILKCTSITITKSTSWFKHFVGLLLSTFLR